MPRSSEIVWPCGQDGDVLQHGLAAIAEARRLDGRDLKAAAQLVDDERGQRLALDILGHDDERLAGLHHRLENRQHRLQRRQLLLVDEDVGVLELGDHLLRVGDEVRGQVAAIELHALDDVELGLGGLRLLDRDHALVADLLHGLGDHVADGSVSPFDEIVPTCATSSEDATLLGARFADVLDDRRARRRRCRA